MSVIGIPGRRFGVGRTIPGQTNWQVYNARGIVLDVDTSAARFTGTPVYITSIGGNSSHWATTGATSVYRASATSFRIYVRWANGNNITPVQANNWQWHINWIGIEV